MVCSVRNITIGEGKPKICIPIVENNQEDMIQSAISLPKDMYDLVEIRIDYFLNLKDDEKCLELLTSLRDVLECPILLTCRTKQEGGEVELTDEEYIHILKTAINSQCIDLIDIELSRGNLVLYQLIEYAHQHHIFVVVSKHDFEKTPSQLEIQETLEKMEIMGGDILKVAYMPYNKQDVLTLINITMSLSSKLHKPLVTISMGELGKITRVCGELIGSSITFASAKKVSAPGQMSASRIHMLLEAIHHD